MALRHHTDELEKPCVEVSAPDPTIVAAFAVECFHKYTMRAGIVDLYLPDDAWQSMMEINAASP